MSLRSHAENFHTPNVVYFESTTINNSCNLSGNDKNNTDNDCQRGALYSKYCMLLVRPVSPHSGGGQDGCLLITPLLFFTSERQTIQNRISFFSGCQFLFLVLALIQVWKFLRKLLCAPPLPFLSLSPSSLPTNRPEHFQRDANYICFILPSERPQSVGFKKARQPVPNIFMNNRLCVCRFIFFLLKGTKTSTYFSVLVESVCSADVLRGAYLRLM